MKKYLAQHQWIVLAALALLAGAILRLWQITQNQFLFYDEGMYLGYNRKFLDLVAANPPRDVNEFFIILGVMVKAALSTAKALWFFILNLRVFFLQADDWFFARVISALSGILTMVLTYTIAWRYFKSRPIALLSILFLAFLPSHVFYSRLGMQESLSTLLFLSSLAIYLFYRRTAWGIGLSALLMTCVYLTNYRMIIAPVFFVAIECVEAFIHKDKIHWKRLAITIASFYVLVLWIGSLYDGINRHVTFGWMSHQAAEAKGKIDFLSLFSFPLYPFLLEGLFFGLLFWLNLYFVIKKDWPKLLPFALVLLQMGIFSLAAEKGARYLCVVLPWMAIAAAVSTDHLLRLFPKNRLVYGFLGVTFLWMGVLSWMLMQSKTEYGRAIQVIVANDPNAGIVSTQALVEQLYVKDEGKIVECPKDVGSLLQLYKEGFRYLVLDPQVYISWTNDQMRFSPPLFDFLEIVVQKIKPLVEFDHLNPIMLNRFVLDHNQYLMHSLRFLSASKQEGYGRIRVYDLTQVLLYLKNN